MTRSFLRLLPYCRAVTQAMMLPLLLLLILGCAREDVAAVLLGASDYMGQSSTIYCQTTSYGQGARTKVVTSCY